MCMLLHNNQVGTSGNIIYFLIYMFCPNTGTNFHEPYPSNHVIPHLVLSESIYCTENEVNHETSLVFQGSRRA